MEAHSLSYEIGNRRENKLMQILTSNLHFKKKYLKPKINHLKKYMQWKAVPYTCSVCQNSVQWCTVQCWSVGKYNAVEWSTVECSSFVQCGK